MPGKRQPTDLVLLNGRKHLSQAEEAERRSHETRVPPAKNPKPPPWLDESLRKEFRKLGKQLIVVGLYTDLDADVLGMYLTARHQWEIATRETEAMLVLGAVAGADKWSKIQERAFKAARGCASDLGLSVTARCRLVVPQPATDPDEAEDDPFTAMLTTRQRAAGG